MYNVEIVVKENNFENITYSDKLNSITDTLTYIDYYKNQDNIRILTINVKYEEE